MHYWYIKANLKSDDKRIIGRDYGFDMFYSIGVDGKMTNNMKYRLEYERMKVDSNDVDNISIGLLFDF